MTAPLLPASFTGKADLQVHTADGDGMDTARAIFDWNEQHRAVDIIAVTDHDDVRGALKARETWARGGYRFDFVPGIEVSTRSGHVLALWVETQIPAFRGLAETVARIHEAGGLAVIPHPFSMTTRSVGRRALDRVVAGAGDARPDGLEVANPFGLGWDCGRRALHLNQERWQLAETGGSDAHFLEAVGSAYTAFPGQTAVELRHAILARETRGVLAHATPLRTIGLRRLALQQVRGLSVTPRKLVSRLLSRAVS
jgi:predicted metal-dependent phosphoesterase TrpH